MDSLDHMLTDPLELGPCGDGHGTRIMEDCLLGGTRVSLPEDLLEDPEIFFDVVSLSTWREVLSDSQREHLQRFLPHFPEDSIEQQSQLILALFSGENFRFGNPLHIAQKLFRDGHFNPEVVKYRQLCFKSQYKRYLSSQQQYFHRLLKQILASRSDLLEMARRSGPALPFRQKRPSPSRTPEEREWRTQQRYLKVLREVKEECGDTALSSDEEATLDLQEKFSFEDLNSWLPSSPARSPSPAVPLRVVPTLSTTDMKTADKIELGESDLKIMLKKHHEKRKHQPDHPDLLTGDLTLNDIMTRVNAGRKGSLAALYDLAVLKKKVKEKEEKKKKKIKMIKSEEDLAEPLSSTEGAPPLSRAPSPLAAPAIKEEPLEDLKPCLGINEISSSFFSLLLEILLLEGQASLPMLEERVLDWQSSPASSLNSWFSVAPNWAELVLPALQYLAGESRAVPSSFSPFVEFKEKTQQWKLLGQSQDNEKELAALFQLWLETKDQAFCKQENEDSSDATTPVPRVRTDYVVRPSTGEEKRVFQEQERYRYSQPHKAFTFRMHGFESVVGPVKGVFDKETSLNKAREHSLLRSDRPAYVTILSLVRDAAARLPNGEGTRAEICELLKDSQFLAPDVTSTQVNTVVSGALDRLHYEKDPCVKYDIGRKLWIYLHRDRSEEEFERIHQAQAAAAKARKALQQKPKPPSKVKSSSKENSLKILSGGPSEQSQMSLSDSSMPPTPVTPVTPTTPALPTTPISPPPVSSVNKSGSTAISEPAKSSSGVLLVSSPTMPQLGTMLSPASSQTPPNSQAARVVSHSGSAGLPQVRVVAQPSLPTVTQQSAGPTQTLPQMPAGPQIRVPATVAQTKVVPQTVMATVPVKAQTTAASVQRPGSGPTGLTVASLPATASPASKPATSSPGSSAPSASPAAVIQNVTGQNIIKQVAITGQLGVKPQTGNSIPLTATNFRIQGTTVVKVTPDLKPTEASSSAFRLMPALGVSVADQKGKNTVASSEAKPAATIRIVQGLGVMPPKAGQTITVATHAKQGSSVASGSGTVHTSAVSLPSMNAAVSKTVAVASGAASTPISIGTGAPTVRQVPVSTAVVSTSQAGKLPTRITVPLSVISQPMKGKSVVTAPIIKGNLGANLSGLGRNIILTTMPAGTKLIAGNKPVSFLTAQQLQHLQQQGQATQVRIQTVPASHLQQGTASGSSKAVSTVVVTTAPSPKQAPEQQ
ncbi:nuclear factor related to kappa-B-binding protein isoform X4 [Equus quagga]|uniref:nuclear factor related to kappa-B-binding protein isoform X4 n=1 Tax=Equus quagga TaxID=89248 RepID=UPI001EE16035|nr:nuclear factor related to kappa-B-binding protein isoform X4 [Equus quagga]